MSAAERMAELRRTLDRAVRPAPRDLPALEAARAELNALERVMMGPAAERVRLMRALRRAGMPFDPKTPLEDLVSLERFTRADA